MSSVLSRKQRLQTSTEFLNIKASDLCIRENHFWVQFKKSHRPFSRFGIIATKRVGNAVKRNRAKRLLRELFRIHHCTLVVPCDLVIISRSSLLHAQYSDLESSFITALNKASTRL